MKSETILYGGEILKKLDGESETSFKKLEERSNIKGEELRELLKYLKNKEFISWRMPLFIGTFGAPIEIIEEDNIKLAHKGMEVVLGKREYFNESEKINQTIHNQTNVNNSSEFQVAQSTGNNNVISQVIDNSQISILRKLIEEDEELEEPKKKKLFDILEKFNTLKESGENALELIKKVGGIAIKYVPLFFSLLK